MEIIKLIVACFKFFLPPRSDEVEKMQLAWRYKVAGTLASIVLVITFLILLSVGYFPFLSNGFAQADAETQAHKQITQRIDQNQREIETIKRGLKEMRRDQLDTRLYDTRSRQCAAMLMKNDQALRSEGERLLEDRSKFYSLTQEEWRIPPCDEY